MHTLTLQIYAHGACSDAMTLAFEEPQKYFNGAYKQSYLLDHLENILSSAPVCRG